jgi:hypothetical protein
MALISPEEMEKAQEVLEAVRDEWLQRPGVTAVDLGFKWSQGEMTNRLAIRVHVARKKASWELAAGELFPKEVDGVLVDVIEATYAPQTVVDTRLESAVDGRQRRFETVPLGVSIGSRFTTAGTLGALVLDQDSGEQMILSNWHVLAGRLDVIPGLPIWQPGWIDGGTRNENVIAELSRWMLGPYDAAVARVAGPRRVESVTLEGEEIADCGEPGLGMIVWKSGRSTGLTKGFVDGVKMTVTLNYPGVGDRLLKDVFRIVPVPGSGPAELTTGGDSGAVWVDEESGKAVGLHFAGEIGDLPEHALAHEILPVTRALNVRLPRQEPAAPVVSPREPVTEERPPLWLAPGDRKLVILVRRYMRRLFRTVGQ